MNTVTRIPLSAAVQRPSETRLTMRAEHMGAAKNVSNEAAGIAGAAAKIVQAVQAMEANGGTLNVQPQIAFITGALMRMVKDIGVVEHLQRHGTLQRRQPK